MSNENRSAEAVLSHLSGRQVEVFYALLISSGRYTFLPELYDIFGREATIRFLEIFAGCRIKVPSVERLENLARSTAIYVRLRQAGNEKRQAMITQILAEEYDLTEDRIRTIYQKTKKNLEETLGVRFIKGKRRG